MKTYALGIGPQIEINTGVNFYNDLYNTYNPKTGEHKNYMTGAELFNFADKINTEIQGLNTALGTGSAKTLVINVATSTQAIGA